MNLSEKEIKDMDELLKIIHTSGYLHLEDALKELSRLNRESNFATRNKLIYYIEQNNLVEIQRNGASIRKLISNSNTNKIIELGGINEFNKRAQGEINEEQKIKQIERQKLIDEAEIAAETKKKLKLSFWLSVIGIVLSLAALLVSIIKD